MPERIAPGLGIDAQAVWFATDGDACQQLAGASIDGVDLRVVPAGKPKHLSVGRNASHIRAGLARELPFIRHLAGREVDEGDAALIAIRGVKDARITAHIK